jgi:hypothetical protein
MMVMWGMKKADICPCPFCGYIVKSVYISDDGFYGNVKCSKCHSTGPYVEMNTKDFNSGMDNEGLARKAIDAWNDRKITSAKINSSFQIRIKIDY